MLRPLATFRQALRAPVGVRCFAALPPHVALPLPALSPTMKTGTIAKWLKKEGDEIKPGDSIAEIETDKATMSWDSTDEGFLAKILRPEGATDVPVGEVVAVTVENKNDIAAFKDYKPTAAAAPAAATAVVPTPPAPVAAVSVPAAAAPKVAAPAPAVATPKPAAATPPTAAPKAATPAPAAAASGVSGAYLAFDGWGVSLARSPIGASIAAQQQAYASLFGFTGFEPLAVASDKKSTKAVAVK